MADDRETDENRPNFSSFWKRSKDVLTGRKIVFVPSELSADAPSPGSKDAQARLSDKEKAALRRAQVRRAQIQHRERKANYVKELEHDVAKHRDLIAQVTEETKALREQNEGLRARLANAPKREKESSEGVAEATAADLKEAQDIREMATDDMEMTFRFDEMGAPCFQVTSSPKPSIDSGLSVSMTEPTPESPEMTPEQTQQAINFILALEHICWNHFGTEDYDPEATELGLESGHSLMASSLALRGAPDSVFDALSEASANKPKPSKDASGDLFAEHVAIPPPTHVGGPPPEGTSKTVSPSGEQIWNPPTLTWNTSSLSLWSLYGLANSLNAPDLDLAPVQAWFELASMYPLSLLLRPDIQASLRKEFVGVVKCPHYGAAIERSAFESIVGRVLGPPTLPAGLEGEDEALGMSLGSQMITE